MWRTLLLIGIGGGAGSILRFLISLGVGRYLSSPFPWGTFAVNVIGSFFAGIILSTFNHHQADSPEWRLFLMTGFCGGFTTFSAFTAENLALLQSGQILMAIIYVLSSVLISLLAIWIGFACTS
ncbi:fluoride efflux transporter CrcB [Sphingobacterium sp. lm-10]|uniref:fluoride efflux transporter CrcB n=1 Tax=Sphingobacterium sp. lm-10 TaxID=2944904 RepID=UPI0020214F5E|nr:fluoride efflux transporter CrcB [Sphingobacterium sp. lm-10]MCL7988040.1 fluoride efflux transporter CrcB [Sphingobacterium sp. lm-10]